MNKETQKLFTLIAEGSKKEQLDSAMKLINGAEDQTLRNELSNFGVTMMQAKDSVAMEKVTDALGLYFKKQMALVFCQAFAYGQKYQHAIDLIVIPEAVEKARDEIMAKSEAELSDKKETEGEISE